MHYLIDAYNLIGRSHHIRLNETDKETHLVEFLQQCPFKKKDKIEVVFD